MNPAWAMGWERANGRPPTQRDWEAQINRQRNGGVEEPTTASQVGQFAGPVGTVAGMYAASKLPGLFAGSTAAKEGAKEGAKGIAEYFGLGGGGSTAANTGIAGSMGGTGTMGAGMSTASAADIAAAEAAAASQAGALGSTGLYGTALTYGIPVLGAALIGNGAYNMFKGDKTSGLSDWASRASLGIATGGISEILNGFGLFDKPQTQVEESRWKDLGDQGFGVPDWVANGTDISAKGAGARPDLAADFIGLAPTAGDAVGMGATPAGTWVNNKFAESRDVGDLTAKDIWGYAALPELFGKDYVTTSEANREAIAAKALELGLVSEGKGTIDIKDDPALREYWTSLTAPKSDNQQIADTVKDTVRRLYNK
jgi:hypothetical protein